MPCAVVTLTPVSLSIFVYEAPEFSRAVIIAQVLEGITRRLVFGIRSFCPFVFLGFRGIGGGSGDDVPVAVPSVAKNWVLCMSARFFLGEWKNSGSQKEWKRHPSLPEQVERQRVSGNDYPHLFA